MKLTLAMLIACSLPSSFAYAAALSVTTHPQNVYAIYLDGESTVFNGVGFSAIPNDGVSFLNVPAVSIGRPRPAGQPFTARNRFLDADPAEEPESKGWTLLGINTTSQKITFSGGPLGQFIDTSTEPDGDLFLANLMLPPKATATVQVTLVNGVNTVFEQTLIIGVPEPGTFATAALAAVALIGSNKRFARSCRTTYRRGGGEP